MGHWASLQQEKKKYLLALVVIFVSVGVVLGASVEPQKKGGIVTNGHECAAIGRSILEQGGSAVDAAIAALFCEGVAMPQSMGLGGGFLMTIYIRETGFAETLNAREAAPMKAHKDMFKSADEAARGVAMPQSMGLGGGFLMTIYIRETEFAETLNAREAAPEDAHRDMFESPDKAAIGGLSVAVPGELRGYQTAHERYGKLPWSKLVEPTIALCTNGHLITEYLEGLLDRNKNRIQNNPSLREIFIDPETGNTYKRGKYVKREKLAATLKVIAEKKADALYNGELTQGFVEDIHNMGGIITAKDMEDYIARWETPVTTTLPNNQKLYTSPPPGSGVVLSLILNFLSNFLDKPDLNSVTNWHKIVESFKFGYAIRTNLGDPAFVKGIQELLNNCTSQECASNFRQFISETMTNSNPSYYGATFATTDGNGTAHISVLADNGDAVSVTSTINQYFGAAFVSASTGIILNDEMDDFSSPNISNYFGIQPSPANYIEGGKRPLSSMCPSIIVDENKDVLLVIGAAGGSKITSSIALAIIRHLWFGESLSAAIAAPRLHHQLIPMHINIEPSFSKDIVGELKTKGHAVYTSQPSDGFSALTGISKKDGNVEGSGDIRRTGRVELL